MANSRLAARLRSWRGVSGVREILIEQGFGLFGTCAGWLAEATGEPSQTEDLLTFWNERALEIVSCMNMDPRNLPPHFLPGSYRSALIDAQIERLAFYRPDGTYYLQHPIEKRAERLWPSIHHWAELQKRTEIKDDFATIPTLKGDRLDIAHLLLSPASEYGFSTSRMPANVRERFRDLHSKVYAISFGDLRFAVGYVKMTWGHPRLPEGSLPLVCMVSLIDKPEDYFWIGDMRSLFPEAYVYIHYKSPQSAVWGMKAILALIVALARSFDELR